MGWVTLDVQTPVEDAHLSGDPMLFGLVLFGLANTANPRRAGHHHGTGDGPCAQINRLLPRPHLGFR